MRPFAPRDFDAYAAMLADPEVTRYLGTGATLRREEAWRHMAMLVGHWQLRGFGMWAVIARDRDEMLGRVGFFQPEGWPGFEIGWTIARHAWGRGYATECARAALEHAFGALDRRKVISVIHPRNEASIRVAEKIGESFEREATVNGQARLIYSVDRPDP
ncbi:MAG TPA: GNAT family N-acetyltransferase [Usitatibacter sp.]|nr:GNAT family N-acetyltransferase [Usitatibacter sp.]